MGKIVELSASGDDLKATWDIENEDQVEIARETFNKMTKKGYTAYYVDKEGEKGKVMKKFDPKAGMIIMVPVMKGG